MTKKKKTILLDKISRSHDQGDWVDDDDDVFRRRIYLKNKNIKNIICLFIDIVDRTA